MVKLVKLCLQSEQLIAKPPQQALYIRKHTLEERDSLLRERLRVEALIWRLYFKGWELVVNIRRTHQRLETTVVTSTNLSWSNLLVLTHLDQEEQ